MDTFLKVVGMIVVFVVTVVVLSILMAYPTKWAVNYLFTPGIIFSLFGVAKLTVWKALWLNFICATLFQSSSSSSSKKK